MRRTTKIARLAALLCLLVSPVGAQALDPGPAATDDDAQVKATREPAESRASESAGTGGEECPAALCLHDGLFQVWGQIGDRENFVNTRGVTLPQTNQGGLLFAYSDDNPEILVKVLDGCWHNDHWWVFIGTATDQPFTVAVKHIPSDETKLWNSGGPLKGEANINAFPCDP